MSYQRNLPLIFLIIVHLFALAKAQPTCFDNGGNYTSNSVFQTNLNTVLSSVSTNIGDNGFYNASFGQSPDRVNAFAFCLGDLQLDFCRTCLRNGTARLLQACPNYRQAHLWNDGLHHLCMLRYSNGPILGIVDDDYDDLNAWYNGLTAPQAGQFTSSLSTLLGNLRIQASTGGSLRKVAVGNTSTSSDFYPMIFGMVQCTPDLSSQDCDSCLRTSVVYLPTCCNSSIGARINARSCFIRYEIHIFYNETRLQEIDALYAPPLQPTVNHTNSAVNQTTGAGEHNNNTSRMTIIISTVASTVAGIAILFLIVYFTKKMKQKSKEESRKGEEADGISIVQSLQYDFNVIKEATNNFSDVNKLGRGGFGSVYKGKLPNGQDIAVKRLARDSGQGDLEFKNEVMLLVKLQHRNLVRLLGFSIEGPEKLLVYEFVENGSLDHHLFDSKKRVFLAWEKCYKIIGGIARGILYLHEDSRLRIVHRDLKASNILLDGEMNPKIADFGMARLFVPDETRGCTSRIVGTYGYMSPEYAMHGQFSVKSDVFSFGVLLLEIISGQKNNSFRHEGIQANLISSAWENWRKGTTSNFVDPVLIVNSSMPRDIQRCIHIGLLCVQENATDRPTMASVITMLNSTSINLPVPSHPAFYVHDARSLPLEEFSWGEGNSDQPSKNESTDSISQNEMSVTEFHGR